MFVQVVRGHVTDAAAMRAASDRWQAELKGGAKGYLGDTSGVADDGTFVAVVRFESEEAARVNSERPEQSAWWDETSKLFDAEPTLYDCPTVDSFMGGVSEDASYVQVEIFTGTDVDELRAVGRGFEKLADLRPDLLGVTASITKDRTVVGTNYFTSEAEARESENSEPPPEVMALLERMSKVAENVEYVDLRDPWHHTASNSIRSESDTAGAP